MDQVVLDFQKRLSQHGITLTEQQFVQFEQYFRELVLWNEKMNLTGITEREQVYVKHFYDSLSLAFFVDLTKAETLADIGTGAGFPSIPLKIAFPHLRVTLVDSLNKRIQFLSHVCDTLGLTDVACVHGRAEDLARKEEYRDQFDVVTARAVARLAALNELCLPFVRKDGVFVSMKGSDPQEEVREAGLSLRELRGKLVQVHQFELPIEQAQRHLIVIRKTTTTPAKYPRKAGTPLKSPLV
ncbi:16S rRNA (guanine(527)-N(7))-methyltransferase RsmG [Paenibacillus sp. MBLB4367]|uniref:16S rRNA (guanine(527)-N(7))-methyltransferase RsmG n=1 Tax=Paenibacillus sp. MBLB4367 TaxID=3384767 RepID=UPI0039083FD5